MSRPTDTEIQATTDECSPFLTGEEQSPRFGMSYEEGVDAALRWVLGDAPDPLSDDEE
jgi:hypothetical protein